MEGGWSAKMFKGETLPRAVILRWERPQKRGMSWGGEEGGSCAEGVDSRGKGAFSDPEGLWTSQQEERQGCKRGREKDEKWPDGLGPKTWLVTVRPTITGRELRNTQGGIFDFDRFLKQPRYHVTYYRYKTNP